MKVCFAASSGGHWEELMCLHEIAEQCDVFYVTEEGGQARDCALENIYIFSQIHRHEKNFFLHFLQLSKKAAKIMRKEKPDFIITTGALVVFPFCIFAKLMKCKIIYIESFARIDSPSLTGKLIYPISDLFLVQWKSMLSFYPKAKYIGCIF